MAGMAVCQAVEDGHHDRGRRSVAAHIGDQEPPAALGKLEEVVVVAASPLRGLVMGSQLQARDLRQLPGQERPLDVGHDLELALDHLVGLLQLLAENQILRCAAEKAVDPEPLGKLFGVVGTRLGPHRDDHVEPTPSS